MPGTKKNTLPLGCQNFRTSTLPDMWSIWNTGELSLSLSSRQRLTEQLLVPNNNERGALVSMDVVYFMAKDNIPLRNHTTFMQFHNRIKVLDIENMKIGDNTCYDRTTTTSHLSYSDGQHSGSTEWTLTQVQRDSQHPVASVPKCIGCVKENLILFTCILHDRI